MYSINYLELIIQMSMFFIAKLRNIFKNTKKMRMSQSWIRGIRKFVGC